LLMRFYTRWLYKWVELFLEFVNGRQDDHGKASRESEREVESSSGGNSRLGCANGNLHTRTGNHQYGSSNQIHSLSMP
jgi:hypothetical protein